MDKFQLGSVPIAHRKIGHHKLSHERYARISIPIEILQNWFDSELQMASKDNVAGLFVEAMHKGENLAQHPQDDTDTVGLNVFWICYCWLL